MFLSEINLFPTAVHTQICKFVKHERINDEGQLRLENFLVIVAFDFHYFHVDKMNVAHDKVVSEKTSV